MQVPKGKVTSYSELAKAIGSKAVRAVGTAMAQNQRLIEIPCHRVVKSDGSIGQYASGRQKKIELLTAEGIPVENGRIKDFKKYLYTF